MTTSPSGSSASIPGVWIPLPGSISITGSSSRRPRSRGVAERGLDDLLGTFSLGVGEELVRLGRRVPEIQQTLARHHPCILLSGDDCRAIRVGLDLARDALAKLDDDPLGGALPDPGHRLEALCVAGRDRTEKLADRTAG